jgi:iron uptake system component EfeO
MLILRLQDCDVFKTAMITRTRDAISADGTQRRAQCAATRSAAVCLLLVAVAGPAVASESLDSAVERYRPKMIDDIYRSLAGARELQVRIAAGDLPGAQQAWIDARAGWERSEVFTGGFVPDLDAAIDSWPDAVAGFHGIEVKLFGANSFNVGVEVEELISHLAEVDSKIRTMPLTPQGLLNGIARLAYEVGDSKVDGGESRVSGTSLDDMRNNVEGIDLAYRTLFAAALAGSDAKLAEQAQDQIDRLKALVTVADLKSVDADRLRSASEALIVTLQVAGPKIGLVTPTLEASAK